jgi:ATP-binding cassette subfamily F protein 3
VKDRKGPTRSFALYDTFARGPTLLVVLQVASEDGTHLTLERGRSMLGALGLSGDKALRPISALSGGEKARVALATFVLRPCNVMMLDEPSNHLDKATVEALTAALKKWKGAIMVISHDREFCTALEPTHVARVLPGGRFEMRHTLLGEVDFENPTETMQGREGKADRAPKASNNGPELDRFGLSKKLKEVKRRIAKLEDLIQDEEKKCAEFDSRMMAAGADVEKAMAEQKKKAASQAKLEKYEQEWEAKEEERESLQKMWDTNGFT